MRNTDREHALILRWLEQDTPWLHVIGDEAEKMNGNMRELAYVIQREFIKSMNDSMPTFYRDYIISTLSRVDWLVIAKQFDVMRNTA